VRASGIDEIVDFLSYFALALILFVILTLSYGIIRNAD